MNENPNSNRFDWLVAMTIHADGINFKVTGNSIEFEKLDDKAMIRPRHIRMIHEIQSFMKEIVKENK